MKDKVYIIMNNHLIERIITSNNLECPVFIFENPLLDKNVAKILSKSFVKILKLSQQNLKDNNNLRLSILENIRKLCQNQPKNHVTINENITALLKEVYEQKIKLLNGEPVDKNKDLDAFLIRNIKEININSSHDESSINPEVIQAMNNLDENEFQLNKLFKDIIHWNCSDKKNIHILQCVWENETLHTEDISIKLKSELERILLELCHNILTDSESNIENLFVHNTSLVNIVKRSSDSASCFQICSNILNYVFIMSNFNLSIQIFIKMFVDHVKLSCSLMTVAVLYPAQVSHIVVLLDMNIEELPTLIQNNYIDTALKYLSELKTESENDLIMLLSHYPNWFDIYFNKNSST